MGSRFQSHLSDSQVNLTCSLKGASRPTCCSHDFLFDRAPQPHSDLLLVSERRRNTKEAFHRTAKRGFRFRSQEIPETTKKKKKKKKLHGFWVPSLHVQDSCLWEGGDPAPPKRRRHVCQKKNKSTNSCCSFFPSTAQPLLSTSKVWTWETAVAGRWQPRSSPTRGSDGATARARLSRFGFSFPIGVDCFHWRCPKYLNCCGLLPIGAGLDCFFAWTKM